MSATMLATRETGERHRPTTPFGAPWLFVLCVIEGDGPQAYRIDRTDLILGRGRGADLRIDDELISKRHCRLRTEGGVCTLQDLGSRNGTLLNHRLLESGVSRRLRHLDEIQLGETRLILLCGKHAAKVRNVVR